MTGWFYWTDASVNMAAARTPGVEFVPPILQVPDGAGGWSADGPPVGFPAGKTKTMVIDVTDILDRDDPRLRVFTTLRLYWDSHPPGDRSGDERRCGSTRSSRSRPSSGSAASARRLRDERRDLPERFDWEELAESRAGTSTPASTRASACAAAAAGGRRPLRDPGQRRRADRALRRHGPAAAARRLDGATSWSSSTAGPRTATPTRTRRSRSSRCRSTA